MTSGKATMLNEAHRRAQGTMLLRILISRMRHEGCDGRAGRVELLTASIRRTDAAAGLFMHQSDPALLLLHQLRLKG